MDYGLAISQQGRDVKVAADRFMAVSSSFRSLKIFNVNPQTTTIPAATPNVVTFTHNLGYLAPCIVVYNGSTTLGVGSSYFMSESLAALTLTIDTAKVEVTVEDTFDLGFSSVGDTVYFTCYQFLDTFDTYEADILSTDTSVNVDSADYGVRVSKDGFDVKTCDDVDTIMTSSYFTTIIHKKGIDTTGTVVHNLGYIPSFLGFIKYSGDAYLTASNRSISSDENNLYCELSAGDEFYYVIFKHRTV